MESASDSDPEINAAPTREPMTTRTVFPNLRKTFLNPILRDIGEKIPVRIIPRHIAPVIESNATVIVCVRSMTATCKIKPKGRIAYFDTEVKYILHE